MKRLFLCLLGIAVIWLTACDRQSEFETAEKPTTQAPLLHTSSCGQPGGSIAYYSWTDQEVHVLPHKRATVHAILGVRNPDGPVWEIEHPTQGWLDFAVYETADIAAVAGDDPQPGDKTVQDSSWCGNDCGGYHVTQCLKLTDSTAEVVHMYGARACRYALDARVCEWEYQPLERYEYYKDTTCTCLDSTVYRYMWLCDAWDYYRG